MTELWVWDSQGAVPLAQLWSNQENGTILPEGNLRSLIAQN